MVGAEQLDHETLPAVRLVLRRPSPGDVDAVHRVHSDPVACVHNPGDMLATLAEAEERYARWDAHWRRYGFGYWVVRPGNVASAKVAVRAGLHRAEHLDTDGEDGLDWIFARNW